MDKQSLQSIDVKPSIKLSTAINEKALLVFAHGAGADMNHAFMQNFTEQLNAEHVSVLRFNFPYMDKRAEDGKRRPPDRMPKLLDCYLSILEHVFADVEMKIPVFIGGKSMGGRVAATIANDEFLSAEQLSAFNGVICLGYPFHPQGKPEELRLTPLQQSGKKNLILQGGRDALGNKAEIIDYQLPSSCQLHFFEDGDHDLKPRVKSGYTHSQHIRSAIAKIVSFIDENS
jgi:predicted alpha/beta-hydrolase family hydrolase